MPRSQLGNRINAGNPPPQSAGDLITDEEDITDLRAVHFLTRYAFYNIPEHKSNAFVEDLALAIKPRTSPTSLQRKPIPDFTLGGELLR